MAQQIAKKVKDVNVAEAKEKERVLQLYSFKMVEEADNIKNNTEKGLVLSSALCVNCTFAVLCAFCSLHCRCNSCGYYKERMMPSLP